MNKICLFFFLSFIFASSCSQLPDTQTELSMESEGEKQFLGGEVEPEGHHSRLIQFFKNGSEEQFFKEAARLLSKSPKDLRVLSTLGIYHLNKNQLGAARLFFNRALEEHKSSALLYNNLAIVELKEENVPEALRLLRKAHSLNSSNIEVQLNLASIYVKYMDYKPAQSLVEDPYQALGSIPAAANNYGVILRVQENYSEARSVYSKALEKNRQSPTILLNYAILLVNYVKDYGKAQEILDQLDLLNSRDPYIIKKVRELEKKIPVGD